MNKSHLIGAVCTILFTFITVSANAELHPRLSGQAAYDDVLNITWATKANLSGNNTWDNQVAWVNSLNAANYLGFNDWRLASMSVSAGLPIGTNTSVVDCSTASEMACRDNELGYMFYHNLASIPGRTKTGTHTIGDVTLFNITDGYWSGTEFDSSNAWGHSFLNGRQGYSVKLTMIGADHGWAVRSGDVAVMPNVLVESDETWRVIAPFGNLEGTPIASVGEPWESENTGWNTDTDFDDSDTAGWKNAIINNTPGEPLRPDIEDYIWLGDPSGDARNGSSPAYFRKSFRLNGDIGHGRLTVVVDDDAQIYVNGIQVLDDQDGRSTIATNVDITPYLLHNENLIAVKAHDSFGIYESLFISLRAGPQQAVNSVVDFIPISANPSQNTDGCPIDSVGKFDISAQLTNSRSDADLSNMLVEIEQLTNGNTLLFDNKLSAAGDAFEIARVGDYADGNLSRGESVDVPFTLCLKDKNRFSFFVNVLAVRK